MIYIFLSLTLKDVRNKILAWKKIKYNILFVGDDWYGEKKWKEFEKTLKKKGVKIVYFPYTKGTSSTLLNNTLKKLRK